jgi:hypothetical protein
MFLAAILIIFGVAAFCVVCKVIERLYLLNSKSTIFVVKCLILLLVLFLEFE